LVCSSVLLVCSGVFMICLHFMMRIPAVLIHTTMLKMQTFQAIAVSATVRI